MQGARHFVSVASPICVNLCAQTHERSWRYISGTEIQFLTGRRLGGLACGVLDITAALIVYGYLGAKPLRLLQGIAGGLLGPRTYSGGIATALLGLLCHFVIAFSAAAVYVAASASLRFWCGTLCSVARCMASPCTSS